MALLEERKKRLTAEGLFDATRKKKLPFLPQVIGVVTSPTGAVIRDIMHRLNARFPTKVLLWPVAVQGERAAQEIAAAITGFNAIGGGFPKPDLLIVARGGGSVEDLMAFNDEVVVRAAAASRIPLISAVGHETDTTLIDFAADMRAPTPTAAAELAVPVRTELLSQTMNFERRMLTVFTRGLEQRSRHLAQLARVLPRPDQLFAVPRQRLDVAGEKLGPSLLKNLQKHRIRLSKTEAALRPILLRQRLSRLSERLENLGARTLRCERAHQKDARSRFEAVARLLEGVSHKKVLERGFALVTGADGKLRRRAASLKPGEGLTLTFADGEASATAGGESATAPSKPKTRKTPSDQGNLF
jgi:exodeoxyribonuclease VII large subunit